MEIPDTEDPTTIFWGLDPQTSTRSACMFCAASSLGSAECDDDVQCLDGEWTTQSPTRAISTSNVHTAQLSRVQSTSLMQTQ